MGGAGRPAGREAAPLKRAAALLTLLLILGCWLTGAQAEERRLVTITANSGQPEALVPLVRSQLGPGSSVSRFRGELVINATDAELQKVRALLAQIDSRPRQLLISVRSAETGQSERSSVSAAGRAGGDDVDVEVGSPRRGGDGVELRVESRNSRSNGERTQQVRAMEGSAAYIAIGQRVPFQSTWRSPAGYHTHTELQDVTAGFYLTARVVDDQVLLDIEQQDDRLAGGTIETRQLSTRASGPLGEWFPLGGVNQQQTRNQRETLGAGSSAQTSDYSLQIKVELLE